MRRIIDYLPMATCNNGKWIIDISKTKSQASESKSIRVRTANIECNGKAKHYYDYFRVKHETKTNYGEIVHLFNFSRKFYGYVGVCVNDVKQIKWRFDFKYTSWTYCATIASRIERGFFFFCYHFFLFLFSNNRFENNNI